MSQDTLLRTLVDTRDRQIQKARIQFSNRLSALGDTGLDEGNAQQERIVKHYLEAFDALEKQLNEDIAEIVGYHPVFPLVSAIRGIGPGLAAKLIAMIDITRSPTVSALWRYAGQAVIDGAAEKPVKGQKLAYNKRLKTTCWLIAGSFLKSASPYRVIYDEARLLYDRTHPEWTKGHSHNAALRKMSKLFLSHLWAAWRELEGLPVTPPYIDRDGNDNHRYDAEYFGWPKPMGE